MKLTETYATIVWRHEANLIIEQIEREEPKGNKLTLDDLDNQTKESVMRVTNNLPGKRGYQRWMFARLLKQELHSEDIYKYGEHEGQEGFFQVFAKVKDMKSGHSSPNQFTQNDILSYKGHQGVVQFESEAIKSLDVLKKLSGEGNKEEKHNLISTSQIATLSQAGIEFLGITEDGYQCFKIPQSLKNNEDAYRTYKNILGDCVVEDDKGNKSAGTISFCTMATYSYFNSHLSSDDLYVFFNRKDPESPYQFHYQSNQFRNRRNEQLV